MNESSSRKPSFREVMRPWELVIGSASAAIFAGIIIFAGTRMWQITIIATVGVFIVALVFTAMFVLASKPTADELADIDEQNEPKTH